MNSPEYEFVQIEEIIDEEKYLKELEKLENLNYQASKKDL